MVKRRMTTTLAAGAAWRSRCPEPTPLAGSGSSGGSGGKHHPTQGRLTTVLEGLDGPRGVDALGHGRTLVTETDGTFSLILEPRQRWHHWRGARHGKQRAKIELGQVPTNFAPAIAAGSHGTIWLLTGGASPDEPAADNGATLFKWKPGWAAPMPFADIAAYQ